MSNHPLEKILHPRSIAVAGASANPHAAGYNFTAGLLEYGYEGKIFPVNPKHSEILGMKAYPSIRDIPENVDYVISAIPASGVLDLIEGCSSKGVKAVHLFTARFSETGRKEAADLEQEILKRARVGGIRLIGPNCMGLYSPSAGISFSDAMPKKAGSVGLVSQSGQMAEELGRFAAPRGIHLSKAISYGNAIDLNESDFLDYFARDPETEVIMMYIEGVRDGERLLHSLRSATSSKPVLILKGGQGESGTRAAASHTASLAGSKMILEALIAQSGAVWASDVEELIDLAASFSFLAPINGLRVGVGGGGGGASVLAADQCEHAGLDVIPLPDAIREELRNDGSTIWDWIGNPVDMSIRDRPDFRPGDILQMMAKDANFDLLIAIMSEPHHERQRNVPVDHYLNQFGLDSLNSKPLLAVVTEKGLGIGEYDHWAWKFMCEVRTRLLASRIPFYPTIGRAARAARKVVEYYRRRG